MVTLELWYKLFIQLIEVDYSHSIVGAKGYFEFCECKCWLSVYILSGGFEFNPWARQWNSYQMWYHKAELASMRYPLVWIAECKQSPLVNHLCIFFAFLFSFVNFKHCSLLQYSNISAHYKQKKHTQTNVYLNSRSYLFTNTLAHTPTHTIFFVFLHMCSLFFFFFFFFFILHFLSLEFF